MLEHITALAAPCRAGYRLMPSYNTPIDWDALWRELTWDADEREQSALRNRLRERAAQYAARPQDDAAQDADVYNVLVFRLGEERYGLDVAYVRGVRPLRRLTRVPGVPNFYRGVVNLRGQMTTVLDLRLFFDLGGDTSTLPRELVLVAAHDLHLALLADHVSDLLRIHKRDVAELDMRYAHGVTADHLTLLDADALFTDDRLIVGPAT